MTLWAVLPPMTNFIACEATIFGPCFVGLDFLALALAFDVFTNFGCILDGRCWTLSFADAPLPMFLLYSSVPHHQHVLGFVLGAHIQLGSLKHGVQFGY